MVFRIATATLALLLGSCVVAQKKPATPPDIEQRITELMAKMTLEEKVGQLNQLNGDWSATGPITEVSDKVKEIKEGRIGSMLNITGVEHTRALQEAALQSRLKIPLLFGQDIIHGYRVTFPIPLAEAASWDLDLMERTARIAAKEAAAAGVHWTFAPMVDIARDPRWGRVMEGAGEDPYLGSLIARARVRGFQGKGYGHTDALMACAKHFAAYGAAIGGRDYNSVDMSLRTLHEVYLPPFKAAAEEGVATFMNSFNDLNGVPASGSAYLQRDILKRDWRFTGFVVSDWGSIGEMIPHGYVANNKEAAEVALNAGSDMDMESRSYIHHLATLVKEGKVKEEWVNDAVRRVLRKKFQMGLFEDPFRYSNAAREKANINTPEHVALAREAGRKSIVLLKNEGGLLPLSKGTKTIALIGPLVKSEKDMQGFWSYNWGKDDNLVSLYEGVQAAVPGARLLYAEGCSVQDSSRTGFAEALAAARQADVVIMAVGEKGDMSGEAKSRANIHMPGVQEELVKAIQATGKPVVVLLMAGRPLVFNWTADHVPAILYTWWLGSQAGNAMADVLFGAYNPAGKLPMTFPRSEGQIPIYYNYLNTGRPAPSDSETNYRSAYIDMVKSPRYAFGHGLSYTTFTYSDLKLSDTAISKGDSLTVSFTLRNTGRVAGEEVAQLYIQDLVAQPVRPVKELKGFRKLLLQPGESKTLTFTIGKEQLAFYNDALEWITQPGTFKLMIGGASDKIALERMFELTD